MSDCCSKTCSGGVSHNRHICPVNGKQYKEVTIKTVLHHIKQPWDGQDRSRNYYFCDDPECDVVYFGNDNTIIGKSAIRTAVGVKEKSGHALVCYCFGITVNEAVLHPEARAFVIEKTKEQVCECEARNPSGRCCLKDFPDI